MSPRREFTHRERMMAAIRHEPADRLPSQIDFSGGAWDQIKARLNIGQVESAAEYLDNHIIYAFFDDTLGRMRRTARFSERYQVDEFGVSYDTSQEGICVAHSPMADQDDFLRFDWPDPEKMDLMGYAGDIVKRYGDEYIVSSNHVMTLFERAWALRGMENFFCDMLADEDFAASLLERIADYQVAVARQAVRTGVNCGRTSDDYGTQRGMFMAPDLWRRLIKPQIKRIWDVYHEAGLPVIHHSCGDIRPIIGDLIECGVDVLNDLQSECMPRRELADRFGRDICFYGGLSAQKILVYGTPAEVKQDVADAISVLGRYNGYCISPGVTLTTDVPLENIIALVEAVRDQPPRG